jgi:hypothetical protein
MQQSLSEAENTRNLIPVIETEIHYHFHKDTPFIPVLSQINPVHTLTEPEYRSRYSDWLRAGQPRGRSLIPSRGKISLLIFVQTSSRAHAASYKMETVHYFPGLERPGCVAEHSPPGLVVKKTWVYTSTPSYFFVA